MKKKKCCECNAHSSKKVVKHLKGDIAGFKSEIAEDKQLIGSLKNAKKSKNRQRDGSKARKAKRAKKA